MFPRQETLKSILALYFALEFLYKLEAPGQALVGTKPTKFHHVHRVHVISHDNDTTTHSGYFQYVLFSDLFRTFQP